MNIARLFIILMGFLAGLVFGLVAATAQFLPTNTRAEATVALPDCLTPELVDDMLARMTDAQIRGLLAMNWCAAQLRMPHTRTVPAPMIWLRRG